MPITSHYSSVLKNSNFVKLWLAQFISVFVANLLNFVVVVRIFESLHSNTAIAIFWMIYALPTVILGLFAGVLIDYWSKRKVLLLTNVFQAAAALLYLPLGRKVWPIYGVVFLYSLIDEFFRPAQEASLPSFVKKENLPLANGLMVFSLQGAGVLGYILAGPLMRRTPPQTPYFLGSVLLLLGALVAALLPVDAPANHQKPLGNGFAGFISDLKEGYQVIRSKRKIWTSVFLMTLAGAMATLVVALIPSISENIFGRDLRDAAPLIIPPAASGAILATLAINRLIKVVGRVNLTRLGFFLMGSFFLLLSFLSPRVSANLLFMGLAGFLAGISLVIINTLPKTSIQENTPFGNRGRVFGALRTLITLASGIPMLLGAAAADLLGLRPVLSFAGIIVLVGSFWLLRGDDGV